MSLTIGLFIVSAASIGVALLCVAAYRYLEPKPNWQFSPLEERLREQIKMQWRWATLYGIVDITLTVVAWGSATALLGISTYNARVSDAQKASDFWFAILTSLSVGIPLLLNSLDVRAQQRVYNRAALAFDALWRRLADSKLSGKERDTLEEEIAEEYSRVRSAISEHLTVELRETDESSKLTSPARRN